MIFPHTHRTEYEHWQLERKRVAARQQRPWVPHIGHLLWIAIAGLCLLLWLHLTKG